MKRIMALLSLVVPAGMLGLYALRPELDGQFEAPLFHFYVVTFSTFAAVVVAIFASLSMGSDSPPRHQLLATAFAAIAAIFFIHGIATPGAISFTFNPGIRWGAWLTMFVGGLLFALAALDRPAAPMPRKHLWRVNWALFLFVTFFYLVVAFAPQWMTAIDDVASPWHEQFIFWLTTVIWAFAAVRLWQTWRATRIRVDAVMALIAGWMLVATTSMHQFPLFWTSWWLYHILLLLGAVTALAALANRYEQLRQFSLTRYYAVLSLIVTAGLALVASNFFSQAEEQDLVRELSRQSLQVGENLVADVMNDLPEMAMAEDLRALAAESGSTLAESLNLRLIGLEDIGVVNVYDDAGQVIYSGDPELMAQLPQDEEGVLQALDGIADAELFVSPEPILGSTVYLQTHIPIHYELSQEEDTLGVLETIQGLPGLASAVIRARRAGLIIAFASMGFLFLALLVIVNRSDKLITARSRELAQAYTDLKAAEEIRDDLTDMIVHDLRSPLTAIKLNLDLLEKAPTEPDKAQLRDRFMSNASDSVQRMLGLIEDLLGVARLEAGRLEIAPSLFHVTDLLSERAAAHATQAEAGGKRICLDAPEQVPAVSADVVLIGRVLDNLIGNALKYTDRGGSIVLGAAQNDSVIQVKVADDGQGIPETERERIFDKFVQVTDEEGRAIRHGTGLGLAFCKLVVEAHHGRIWVESAPGQGSTFNFTLPLM